MGADRLDSQIAADWGIGLAHSVVKRIARGEDDQLKTTNRADFVAHFLDALLRGSAWQTWYYYPFAHLRARSTRPPPPTALMEERALIPEILVAMADLDALDICCTA
ncbi:MAG: hypothetical protein U0703_25035 [Anaerolineae bacterium]